eukprot:16807-Heterococcus_DN1.PRE.4
MSANCQGAQRSHNGFWNAEINLNYQYWHIRLAHCIAARTCCTNLLSQAYFCSIYSMQVHAIFGRALLAAASSVLFPALGTPVCIAAAARTKCAQAC